MYQLPEAYYQLLEEIQSIDFVLVELTLYLDTHPNDAQAIQQYNHYDQQVKQLKERFVEQYGPLQQGDYNGDPNRWIWGTSPWPWQV